MKSKLSAVCAILGASALLCGQNIVKNSDFNNHEKTVGPEFRTNGGKVSLFTEDATWNRCGKLTINKEGSKSGRYKVYSACVWIGGSYANNNAPGGFVCKPNTTYDFSIDVKGVTRGAGAKITYWKKDTKLWYGKTGQTTLGGFKISKDWQTFKGSFTTPADATNVALALSIWEQQTPTNPVKVGDYILFDNISIKERKRPTLNAGGAPAKAEINLRKIIPADGTVYNDFKRFKSTKPLTAKTSFKVNMTDDAFVIDFECEEPNKITLPKAGGRSMWSGDLVEIFFGPKQNDRAYSQFVVSPDGKTYAVLQDNGTPLPMEAKITQKEKSWGGTVRITYASLGWKKPAAGDSIIFNFARQRLAAKEYSSWAHVTEGFSDLRNCGKIYCGSFPAGVARADFEKSEAEKEAAARQAKLDAFRTAKFLYAPVKVTDDFTLPYQPDAIFDPVKKIELRAAVNEIKPLPFALLNNTDKTAVYQVTVEFPPEKAKALPWHNGKLFPGVTYREAVAIRANSAATTLIYDPLAKMNETRTVTVAAGECALLWFDFDTTGFKPGVYNARLRILPFTGKGIFTKRGYGFGNNNYESDMVDIPLTLTVSDIELSKEPSRYCAYFAPPVNDATVKMQADAGARMFQVNPWGLNFALKDGKFDIDSFPAHENFDVIKRNGYDRIWVGYSCYHVFGQLYGKKNYQHFPAWVKAINDYLIKHGFDPKKCFLELYDEPDHNKLAEIEKNLNDLKALKLDMKISMTLGAHIMSAENMRKFGPFVDDWCLWRSGYFSNPDHIKFIKDEMKRGVSFGHYTCYTTIRAPLDKNFRRNAWFGEYHDLTFNGMYQAIDGVRNSHFKGNNGGALIHLVNGVPIPSVRYMAVRQGVNDVKYLAKLREVGKDSAEAQKFLKTAARRVLVEKAHDPNEADRVREEAAELILKVQKK